MLIRSTSPTITRRAILLAFALCVAFVQVGEAAALRPEPHHESLPSQRSLPQPRDVECGIPGNPDIYGLGIRLGLYMLWIATMFTYEFLDEEVSNALDTNIIFFFSIGVATFVLSTQTPRPYVEEIYILLCIFFGGFWSLAFPSSISSFSMFGMSLRCYLMAGMASYAVWYWFGGMDGLRRQPCGSHVFLFAEVDLFGRARTFFKAASVINLLVPTLYILGMELLMFMPGLVTFALFLLVMPPILVTALVVGLRKGKITKWRRDLMGTWNDAELWPMLVSIVVVFTAPGAGMKKEKIKEELMPKMKQARKDKPFYRRYPLLNYGVLIWTIVSIELTLVWNKIDDVHSIASTGQLIPFVTGITGILRVIWVYIGQRIEKSKYNTVSFDKDEQKPDGEQKPTNEDEEEVEEVEAAAQEDTDIELARRHTFA